MRRRFLERNTPPAWNARALTEDDFWRFCQVAGVTVYFRPMERLGFFTNLNGRPTIYIRDTLSGFDRAFTLWHEMGHFWLHPPGIQFFHGYDSLVETEADVVAACALIPRPMILHYWDSELIDLHGFPTDLTELRRSIYSLWGI